MFNVLQNVAGWACPDSESEQGGCCTTSPARLFGRRQGYRNCSGSEQCRSGIISPAPLFGAGQRERVCLWSKQDGSGIISPALGKGPARCDRLSHNWYVREDWIGIPSGQSHWMTSQLMSLRLCGCPWRLKLLYKGRRKLQENTWRKWKSSRRWKLGAFYYLPSCYQ